MTRLKAFGHIERIRRLAGRSEFEVNLFALSLAVLPRVVPMRLFVSLVIYVVILQTIMIIPNSEVTHNTTDIRSSRMYYIDFENGSDAADGRSPETAWKRAPGDPEAGGRVAKASLKGGDIVAFKGGVVYRGSIAATGNGDSINYITYCGSCWGTGMAVLSGYDEYKANAINCEDNPGCPDETKGREYWRINMPEGISYSTKIIIDNTPLQLAQDPPVTDHHHQSDISKYHSLSHSEVKSVSGVVSIDSRDILKRFGKAPMHDVAFFIWSKPNTIYYPESPSRLNVDTGSIEFSQRSFQVNYSSTMKYAVANHPSLINGPGQYSTVASGTAIVVNGSFNDTVRLQYSKREYAFQVSRRKGVEIRGFAFVGYGSVKSGGGAAALLSYEAELIKFAENKVMDIESWNGTAAISLMNVEDVEITRNSFENLKYGRAINVNRGKNVKIQFNNISSLSFTGVLLQNCSNTEVKFNQLHDIHSVHGNGISVYGNNSDIQVSSNTITKTLRPITLHGNDEYHQKSSVAVVRNFISADLGGNGIQSWGKRLNGVVIKENIIIAENGYSIELAKYDYNINVFRNIMSAIKVPNEAIEQLKIQENAFIAPSVPLVYLDKNTVSVGLRDEILAVKEHGRGSENQILCSMIFARGADTSVSGDYPIIIGANKLICR